MGLRLVLCVSGALISGVVLLSSATQTNNSNDNPPPWAYPVNPPDSGQGQPAEDNNAPRKVPGSDVTLTLSQIGDVFNVPDWRPNDHPVMPEVVAYGRRPAVFACGYCHLPNGFGRPENSSLAGLPTSYIVQQMADFKNGTRKSSEPDMRPPAFMIRVAEAANDAEVLAAANYFANVPFARWIRVVETDSVPRTHVSRGMLVTAEGDSVEPIGDRIIEVPEDLERTELRDAASGFVAYVPVGSLETGERLVRTGGGGRTLACGPCHGDDLRGRGPVPPLAGRSPSYTVRQLFDMQQGVRSGLWAELMKDVVSELTIAEMVAIAAYSASLEP